MGFRCCSQASLVGPGGLMERLVWRECPTAPEMCVRGQEPQTRGSERRGSRPGWVVDQLPHLPGAPRQHLGSGPYRTGDLEGRRV